MSLRFLTERIQLEPEERERRQKLWDEAVLKLRKQRRLPTVYSLRRASDTYHRNGHDGTPSSRDNQT